MTLDPAANPKTELRDSKWAALRSPAALVCFLLTMGLGLSLDLWSKAYAWRTLAVGEPFRDDGGHLRILSDMSRPIPGWLHFKVTVNEGAVFGLGQGNQTLFAVVSAAAIAFLCYLFVTSGRRWFYQVVLGMLLAGVLGNLYDRMVFRYVRDMLYIFPDKYITLFGDKREVFPWIFNVADTLLCAGVGLMVVYSFFATEADGVGAPDRKQGEPGQPQPARP
jgi:signal peptidase II